MISLKIQGPQVLFIFKLQIISSDWMNFYQFANLKIIFIDSKTIIII